MNIDARIVETDTETNAMEVRPMESIIRRILIYSPNNSGIHDPGYCDYVARLCTKDIQTNVVLEMKKFWIGISIFLALTVIKVGAHWAINMELEHLILRKSVKAIKKN